LTNFSTFQDPLDVGEGEYSPSSHNSFAGLIVAPCEDNGFDYRDDGVVLRDVPSHVCFVRLGMFKVKPQEIPDSDSDLASAEELHEYNAWLRLLAATIDKLPLSTIEIC
jgi:hypothetical protein